MRIKEEELGTGQDMEMLTRQFMVLKLSRQETSGMEYWESQGMEFLNNVAMSWGGGILREFIMIDGDRGGKRKFEEFGEEIYAHQFLEEKLVELNQTTEYILEEFNTDLRTKSNKEHISDKFKSPPFTDDINVNYNDNNIVCVQDSVQEVQFSF